MTLTKMKKNLRKFDKQVLARYMESECTRQLFLDLGQTNPQAWFKPVRPLKKPKRFYKMTNNLEELGHRYEQKVYFLIKHLFKNVRCSISKGGKVSNIILDSNYLTNLHDQLLRNKRDIWLLEHEYENPPEFFRELFSITNPHDPIPLDFSDQRPDIMIIGNGINVFLNEIRELLPDGTIRTLPQGQIGERQGISVFDIKNIREIKIGKKQFIEVLYYMRTLAYFIYKYKLEDKFYVRVDGNGIFPHLKDKDLFSIKTTADFLDQIIKIPWEESNRIFHDIMEEIRELWNDCPQAIEDVPVNVQLSCGYCYFLEDCKATLGMDGDTPPEKWSLKLLPYNSISISEQLMERGFKTIGDIAKKISTIRIGDTPEPIYSELPLLELKANALIENTSIKPKLGQIHSYSIPKYTDIALTFAVETDPANQRVYGASLYLYMSVPPNAPYSAIFDNWWRIWKEGLENSKNASQIHAELQPYLFNKISLRYVELFYDHLLNLKNILIFPKGMLKKNGTPRKQTIIIYQYAIVNKKESDKEEVELARNLIYKINTILSFCNIIENHIVVEGQNQGEYFGPRTSIFYWSARQLNNFQDMLERSLENLVNHPRDAAMFESILSLFTPSDSEVKHPYQHKKLFNVRTFAETIFGFPSIISYTWHEIAKKELNRPSHPKFWIPHFNYMDFNSWHEYLLENRRKVKRELEREIKLQLIHKVRTINDLRIYLQRRGGEMISKHSRTISDSKIQEVLLPNSFHPIAFVWYLFSKYTGTMDELEADIYRTIYPEYSIGKLVAARVKHLKFNWDLEGKLFCTFAIIGLSSNMKINEGDRVYLLPGEERGRKSGLSMRNCEITIEKMEWTPKLNGYQIYSKNLNTKFYERYIGNETNHEWFLYPRSMDSWSKKLYGTNGLLLRDNMGRSWLGARLSYLWNIRSKPVLYWPKKWTFTAPSVYLFAPELLFQLISKKHLNINQNLITKISPTPDISQKKAINHSLFYHISGIQGPPGTGKSQTIAALIDEYYMRCKQKGQKSVKILVTAFSYSALRVVIDKIRTSKNQDEIPTPSSKMQMIFLRSNYQKPVEPISGTRHVDDLQRKYKTWKWNGKSNTVTPNKPLENLLEDDFILFANAHQLHYLRERVSDTFAFDLIIVDEASQVPVDHFMASLHYIHKHAFHVIKPLTARNPNQRVKSPENVEKLELDPTKSYYPLTKIVIVGDYNQLPPVQPVQPPKNLKKVLDSLFGYYVKSHGIPNRQLKVNYRSNKDIVNYTRMLGIYRNLKPHPKNALRTLDGTVSNLKKPWLRQVLDPKKSIVSLIHDKKYEIGVSALEAKLVAQITIGYFDMISLKNEEEEQIFWSEKLGVVAPHNAQGRLIIRNIYECMTNTTNPKTHLDHSELMRYLKNSIYSVEKFQGSDRELIISSIGISDRDQLNAESEFIYNLNRFNVLTSRAKAKIILICSKKFLDFIPNEREVMIESAKIRNFACNFCNVKDVLHVLDEKNQPIEIEFRYKK
ncbi:MAG: AAA domain-containing protein [Promethearchaeota archaeon]